MTDDLFSPSSTLHLSFFRNTYLVSSILLRLLVQNLLDRRAGDQLLVPLIALGVVGLPLLLEIFIDQEADHGVPGNEHQVRVGDLVANEVGLVGLCEVQVDDAQDALDFVAVAIDCAGDVLFGVELRGSQILGPREEIAEE